jgi:hypothetical protein
MIRRSQPTRRARGILALAIASAVALATIARAARAEPTQRVSIRVPARADALLDEALVRVRGELGAMGLTAEVEPSDESIEPANREEGVGGTLTVERDGVWIRIRALGPASTVPVVQELDTRRSDVTAEVVAVRAVEALRAVMSGLPERPVPAAKPPPKPAPPPAKPTPPPQIRQPGPALSLAPRGESALSVWAGANGRFDVEPSRPAMGAELGLFWGRSSFFGGALLSTSLLHATLNDAAGQVSLRRSAAIANVGFALELTHATELWLMLGGGLAHHRVEGKAAAGYIGVSGEHDTPLFAASLGATGFFARHVGAYLKLEACVATDAPAVRVTAREIAILDRPSLGATLGLVLRAPRSWAP